ncbi:MAG: DUF541 domain-containing protein, partial [Desulfuromonadales bacterium]|nr:DUF541 domain-containing protein [Desulfuromonadales bacterium]
MPRIFNLLTLFLLVPVLCFAELSTVTVQGTAELQVPADRANFVLSVVSRDKIPRTAMQENSARSEKVLDALQRAGLVDKEISTGRFVVSPVWSQRPRPAPTDWKPEIIGYTVTNTLRVKTAKIDQVGAFIAAAVKAGSNEVKGLHFDILDRRRYRQEAIRIATERASEDARVLA